MGVIGKEFGMRGFRVEAAHRAAVVIVGNAVYDCGASWGRSKRHRRQDSNLQGGGWRRPTLLSRILFRFLRTLRYQRFSMGKVTGLSSNYYGTERSVISRQYLDQRLVA